MIIQGDCLEKLRAMDANSVAAVVTDPPYGLAFMGKKWDYDVPSVDVWREVLRVMKPGAHLLSFGGTRTYHRMVVAIEDAGFEIRDQLQWIYGSGFPKSLDVSKAIDKAAKAEREVVGATNRSAKRGSTQGATNGGAQGGYNLAAKAPITAPSTDAAKQWSGWGTALEPANEPIVLARKPLGEKTVAANVLRWGTGAINVDGTRIGYQLPADRESVKTVQGASNNTGKFGGGKGLHSGLGFSEGNPQGRFPANLILDETAAAMLDAQSGTSKSTKLNCKQHAREAQSKGRERERERIDEGYSDSGGASRFFYVAKASRRERNAGLEGMPKRGKAQKYGLAESNQHSEYRGERANLSGQNHHPTVKPVALMRYLVRLITPPGGLVLDPFCGSGTTGIAAKLERAKFIGIEREAEYVEISDRRIAAAEVVA